MVLSKNQFGVGGMSGYGKVFQNEMRDRQVTMGSINPVKILFFILGAMETLRNILRTT